MAFSNKHLTTGEAEKIVVIAGPAFGEAMKFAIFGAAVGAGATYFLLRSKLAPSSTSTNDAVLEGLNAGGAKSISPQNVVERLGDLSSRLKNVSARASEVAATVSETVKPALQHAVAEGKKAAHETEINLESDLKTAEAEARHAATVAGEDA